MSIVATPLLAAVAASALLAAVAPALAVADFPQDPPNDPNYDRAEENCSLHSVNDEQYYLYSRMSICTPRATNPESAAGMSVDRAWRELGTGRPDVTIAYIEGGINWHAGDVRDLVDKVFLNRGELPAPTTRVPDGRLSARDYGDARDANGNDVVDPEDLIVRYSDGRDDDGNGYVDDISGWDFYHDQNDPATVDSAYDHANNQMRQAAAETDNGFRGAGVCPACTILPIKAAAEALVRTDDLAEAWLYAADLDADVIVSVTADLGYSSFMRRAVEHAWARGIVMVAASNDFGSTDHQGGMFHPHVIPGNGLVTDSQGVPGPGANGLTTTFMARSGQTSWGTKNFTSVSTQGGSTSTSTPTHGGVAALVLSAGMDAAAAGRLGRPLSGAEALQVIRATALDVDDPASNWPSRPGWDLQFGYGRPNVFRAMRAVHDGEIPPVGWISSPDWYALVDPARRPQVRVSGHVEARRSTGYRWRLEWAPGPEPTEGEFRLAGSGAGAKPYDGTLGRVDVAAIRARAERPMALSRTKTLETNERYTVTLRLRVTDSEGRVGEDRRAIAVHRDPSWLEGFPKRIGPGGESQPQLADLQGRRRLATVFGDADGRVHAIDGRTGRELRGFPILTDPTRVTRAHAGIDPGHEPIIANVAVGDLDGHGRLSVVATTTTGRVYVWNARGERRAGWPRSLDAGVQTPTIPRPRLPFTRLPVRGATAPPVLADLSGGRGLEIVQAGWDGRLHAWTADGADVDGWPVEVIVDAALAPPAGYRRLQDHKLDTPPAVADLDGSGRPEIVVRSQYSDILGPDLQPFPYGHVHAYHADGTPVAGWPRKLPALAAYYGSAQEFITEGANAPVAADIDGDGDDEVTVSPIFSGTLVLERDGSVKTVYGPVPDATTELATDVRRLQQAGSLPADFAVSFTTSGAFGRFGQGLAFAEPGSGLLSIATGLLLTGSGVPITHSLRTYDARSTLPRPGFPARIQGLDFLGGPAIADVTGDGRPELLVGGDTSALHAFTESRAQARGFPKFHSGWMLYAPATGDIDGDGDTDVVAATREGYLSAWSTPGVPAGNAEWWSFRHDERNTGRYGTDTRPPGVATAVKLSADGRTVTFTAPGGDWYAGAARRYEVRANGRSVRVAGVRSGERVRVRLSDVADRVTVRAVDAAGNRAAPASADRAGSITGRSRGAAAGPGRRTSRSA
jgi:hypothetical protein